MRPLFEGAHLRAMYIARLVPALLIVALGFLASCLVGCNSPLRSAAEIANYSAAVGEESRELVHDTCTAPMQQLAAEPASDARTAKGLALAARCDAAEEAQRTFRQAHLALVAGIVRAQRDMGITVGELVALADATVQAILGVDKTIRAASTATSSTTKAAGDAVTRAATLVDDAAKAVGR